MFERFTDKAMHVIMLSQKEARRLGHRRIGTEQILVGLAMERSGLTRYLLDSAGFNLTKCRNEIERMIGVGNNLVESSDIVRVLYSIVNMMVPMPLTDNAITLLQRAISEADKAESQSVNPEHVLLALAKMHDCRGSKLLIQSGVQLLMLQDRILASTSLA